MTNPSIEDEIKGWYGEIVTINPNVRTVSIRMEWLRWLMNKAFPVKEG